MKITLGLMLYPNSAISEIYELRIRREIFKNNLFHILNMKNLTARVAWHDSSWNGKICRNPELNHYCRDSHSLLSSRIDKRIDLEIEANFSGKNIEELAMNSYYPPCYWSINAFGGSSLKVSDIHPFHGMRAPVGSIISRTPPYKPQLIPNSIFTWCFKLGFMRNSSENYNPFLERNLKDYLGEIVANDSLVFLYANYSNPVNGDRSKYLVIGAAKVSNTENPGKYDIPRDDLDNMRKLQGMKYFPEVVWQFRVDMEPETQVLLPYHQFLEWKDKGNSLENASREKTIDEIAVSVTKETIVPHFKYVSMHINHDKSLYILYDMLRSIGKMKDHPEVVDIQHLEEMESRLNSFIKDEWAKRGRYPGFTNLLATYNANIFHEVRERLKYAAETTEFIKKSVGSIDKFLNEKVQCESGDQVITQFMQKAERDKETFKFLAQFDLSVIQFKRIKELIDNRDIAEFKDNPYLIMEHYNFEEEDDMAGNTDLSDYGISFSDIDLALMPDPRYARWRHAVDPDSPKRLRALISEILKEAAEDGDTFLTRDDIIERLKQYPLVYAFGNLEIDNNRLIEYEHQSLFREKFNIENMEYKFGEVLYQLRSYREIEDLIKQSIEKMLKKSYRISEQESSIIDRMLNQDRKTFLHKHEEHENERMQMYTKALTNGFLLISGKAGSGKTSGIVNLVREFQNASKRPVLILTPTGRSSLVIRDRLRDELKVGLQKLSVMTIHRFLYSSLFQSIHADLGRLDPGRTILRNQKSLAKNLVKEIGKFLEGNLDSLKEIKSMSESARFRPSALVIDEASMIDERLIAALFLMVDFDSIDHLIIVGDEKQLPPIGPGRPFADIAAYLKREELDKNYIRLEANYRFSNESTVAAVSSLLEADKPDEGAIGEYLQNADRSVSIRFFEDSDDLRGQILAILSSISSNGSNNISEAYADALESGNSVDLNGVQILTPRRYGRFASAYVNSIVMKSGVPSFGPRTKLICEENRYITVNKGNVYYKILALANGSLGFINKNGEIKFDDLDDLEKQLSDDEYALEQINDFRNEVRRISYKESVERSIDLGYAVTVHKAQGSDFGHVILIIPEASRFLSRELLYTAITRIRSNLYILLKSDLKNAVPELFSSIHANTEIGRRKTLMFFQAEGTTKLYPVGLESGRKILVRSKIEKIIAENLKDQKVNFEYEPQDLFQQYSMVPDFKIVDGGKTYYLEHLGRMDNGAYRTRWFKKLEKYKLAGLEDKLVTTSETPETIDQSRVIAGIISDIRSGNLRVTEGGFSKHHHLL